MPLDAVVVLFENILKIFWWKIFVDDVIYLVVVDHHAGLVVPLLEPLHGHPSLALNRELS